jgi:hypothetical protein
MKMTNYNFIPGIELNKGFYIDVVKPLLNREFPELKYTASLIGCGSDVLGYDNRTSMDHNWGPRLQIFLSENDFEALSGSLTKLFQYNLPFEYNGFPTNYTIPRYDQTQSMEWTTEYPVNHLIEVHTLPSYLKRYLGVENVAGITHREWLSFTDINLLEITKGEVFHDGLGELKSTQEELSFYPFEIWLLRLAALWRCIENEEPFIGRCRENNDFLGVKTISARLVNYIMKICFYLEKEYIPYSKWIGTAFKRLKSYSAIEPNLKRVLVENDPEKIEYYLVAAYEKLVELHNERTDLPRLDNKIQNFFGRPYKVIFAETIVQKLKEAVNDSYLKNINIDEVGLDLKIDSIDLDIKVQKKILMILN